MSGHQIESRSFISSFWMRLPVMLRAVLTGILLAIAGTLPWAYFVSLNIRHWPGIPWALLPTALYLWVFWKYLGGNGWPRATSEIRKKNLRAHKLSGEIWGASILCGILGLITVVAFQIVLNRLIRLPAQNVEDLSQVPIFSLFSLLIMSAAVAGVVEEAAFRGYMQVPIERRHGPLTAILITGTFFGLLHFTHSEFTLLLMPFYMAIAAIYGTLAYLVKSILPGIFLHAGGNILASLDLLVRGNSEWQVSAKPAPLIWETGTNATFWISVIVFLGLTAVTIRAYISLANLTRNT